MSTIKEIMDAVRREVAGWPEWRRREIDAEVMKTPLRDAGPLHVYPLDDLREHVIEGYGELCWCGVRVDDGIVVHTGMDGREDYEAGRRKPS